MTQPTDYLARILAGPDRLDHGIMAEVRKISDGHTERDDKPGEPWRVVHDEPVVGCAWCLTDDEARPLDHMLDDVRPLDGDDWEVPHMRGARLLTAGLMLWGLRGDADA